MLVKSSLLAVFLATLSAPSPVANPIEASATEQAAEVAAVQARAATSNLVDRFGVTPNRAERIVAAAFDAGRKTGTDPLLLLSIASVESGFTANAVSPVGALGMMQIMPRWHQDKISKLGLSGHAIMNVEANVHLGALVLKDCLRLSKGNVAKALQRYNGSHSDRSMRYSSLVMSRYHRIKAP